MASGESLKILRPLQARPENKVCDCVPFLARLQPHLDPVFSSSHCCRTERPPNHRCAWIAPRRTRSGRRCRTASSCAWSAAASTAAWACTSALCGARPRRRAGMRSGLRRPGPGLAATLGAPPPRRSVTMDAWSGDQLRKMQLGGNDALNSFLAKYGVEKDTEIPEKYNSQAAEVRPARPGSPAARGAEPVAPACRCCRAQAAPLTPGVCARSSIGRRLRPRLRAGRMWPHPPPRWRPRPGPAAPPPAGPARAAGRAAGTTGATSAAAAARARRR